MTRVIAGVLFLYSAATMNIFLQAMEKDVLSRIERAKSSLQSQSQIRNPLINNILKTEWSNDKDESKNIKTHLLQALGWHYYTDPEKGEKSAEYNEVESGLKRLSSRFVIQPVAKGRSLPKFSNPTIEIPEIKNESLNDLIATIFFNIKKTKIDNYDIQIENNNQSIKDALINQDQIKKDYKDRKVEYKSVLDAEERIKNIVNKQLKALVEKASLVTESEMLSKDIILLNQLLEQSDLSKVIQEKIKQTAAILGQLKINLEDKPYRDEVEKKEEEKEAMVIRPFQSLETPEEEIPLSEMNIEKKNSEDISSSTDSSSESEGEESSKEYKEQLSPRAPEEYNIHPAQVITKKADESAFMPSNIAEPETLTPTEFVKISSEADISYQAPDQATEDVALKSEEIEEVKAPVLSIEEKKPEEQSEILPSSEESNPPSNPSMQSDFPKPDPITPITQQQEEPKLQQDPTLKEISEQKKEASFWVTVWSKLMSLFNKMLYFLTTPLI